MVRSTHNIYHSVSQAGSIPSLFCFYRRRVRKAGSGNNTFSCIPSAEGGGELDGKEEADGEEEEAEKLGDCLSDGHTLVPEDEWHGNDYDDYGVAR
ncbi:hypothetical protein CDL15_Pgr008383 [Punica granatum]|uniref:Uncharacterized protein n=1 Tax=Punica granatum TaxID=22663 RepID=A0A218WPZ7_PUNGR|nr:hypothetical protein CDL15_Pgr008383 [Punica granatum]